MNFYEKQARRPSVPIVSLIDILAILLIFFIVTTTFKEKKILLEITVPKSAELESLPPSNTSRVTLGVTEDGQIFLAGKLTSIDGLDAALEELKKTNPGAKLELKADQVNSIGNLVSIWDSLAKAGFAVKDVPIRLERPKPK